MNKKASKLIAITLTALAIITASPAFAGRSTRSGSVQVRGYTTKSGKYVAPHHRTRPDHSTHNNYSTKGNVNPYTGKEGTVNPDAGKESTVNPDVGKEGTVNPDNK